jgi:leucyl-tRNA synthetase
MELINFNYSHGTTQESAIITTQLIAPFAPFLAEELWSLLGQSESVHQSIWPTYDQQLVIDDTATIVVQVNGKVRDKFEVQRNTGKDEVQDLAFKIEKIQKYTIDNKYISCSRIWIIDRLKGILFTQITPSPYNNTFSDS